MSSDKIRSGGRCAVQVGLSSLLRTKMTKVYSAFTYPHQHFVHCLMRTGVSKLEQLQSNLHESYRQYCTASRHTGRSSGSAHPLYRQTLPALFPHTHTCARSNLPLQNDATPPANVCPSKAEVIHTSESVKLLLASHVEEKATEPWKCTNYSDRET